MSIAISGALMQANVVRMSMMLLELPYTMGGTFSHQLTQRDGSQHLRIVRYQGTSQINTGGAARQSQTVNLEGVVGRPVPVQVRPSAPSMNSGFFKDCLCKGLIFKEYSNIISINPYPSIV
tara:strand:+ start:136 stop:498 length:363 start_codon:yes stop_codon:yes gene_type:complete